VGDRYETVTFEVRRGSGAITHTRVDARVRQRLRSVVDSAPNAAMRADVVLGVLVEADFEKNTARLRSPARQAVDVSFTDKQADDIQAALRQQATLRGEVAYDPRTPTVQKVLLREVVRGRQLVLHDLDPEEFWQARTFDDLAEAHGTASPLSVDHLYSEASEDERDAFMAALAELAHEPESRLPLFQPP